MPLRHKHPREHANRRANPPKTAPGHVRNDHAAPLDASAEGNAGRRLPEGQSTRPRLPPGTTRSSAGCPASAPPVAARSGACPRTSLRRGATDKRWRPYREFLCPAFDGHERSSASAESARNYLRRAERSGDARLLGKGPSASASCGTWFLCLVGQGLPRGFREPHRTPTSRRQGG